MPFAIIIAGMIIGLSVIYAVGQSNNGGNDNNVAVVEEDLADVSVDDVRPVDETDHILGNVDAPIKIVEYSDTECPFCKRFHYTMKQVVKDYGGQVAWVYRHFPLEALHSKAQKEAEALECAGEQGGNVKFWAFLDRLMDVTPSNDGLPDGELSKIAAYVKLNVAEFDNCLTSGKYAGRVSSDAENASASGGEGTPYSIAVSKTGELYPISGAYPLESVKAIIDRMLGK